MDAPSPRPQPRAVSSPERREQLQRALADVAAGDRPALKTVYDLTSMKVYGVIVRIVRDRERADDVLQDVYLKVWDRAGRYDAAKAGVITWLCAIARNSAIDTVRRDARVPVPIADDTMPEPADSDPLADELLCVEEEYDKLRRCLDELGDDQRKSVRLAFFEGLTHSELSEVLGAPLGTVKSWIRRGLAGLKACLRG
jgi:RNA polymerase sigma-70 factor (ECF subfamily)